MRRRNIAHCGLTALAGAGAGHQVTFRHWNSDNTLPAPPSSDSQHQEIDGHRRPPRPRAARRWQQTPAFLMLHFLWTPLVSLSSSCTRGFLCCCLVPSLQGCRSTGGAASAHSCTGWGVRQALELLHSISLGSPRPRRPRTMPGITFPGVEQALTQLPSKASHCLCLNTSCQLWQVRMGM